MATQVQLRRGNNTQTLAFTGAEAEITVDTDKETVVVHDGSTAGGFPLAKEATANSAGAYANSGFSVANSASSYANSAFNAANTAQTTATNAEAAAVALAIALG